jgi:hypothetical protein
MKTILLIFSFIFITQNMFSKDKSNYKVYHGAWFDIQYPKTFRVENSIPSSLDGKFDSVYFVSPDKKVKFYIFSPQWAGDAVDIGMNAEFETLKDEKIVTKNGFTTKWYTYESSKGLRSYQEITNEDQTTKHIIGIEYTDVKSYSKYKKDYLHFKKSLKQFAD